MDSQTLQSKQDQESNHKTEKTQGLWQTKTQDGIGEKLLFERWVTGVSDDQAAEYCSDTSSGSGHSYGGGTSSDEFGCSLNITTLLHYCGVESTACNL